MRRGGGQRPLRCLGGRRVPTESSSRKRLLTRARSAHTLTVEQAALVERERALSLQVEHLAQRALLPPLFAALRLPLTPALPAGRVARVATELDEQEAELEAVSEEAQQARASAPVLATPLSKRAAPTAELVSHTMPAPTGERSRRRDAVPGGRPRS